MYRFLTTVFSELNDILSRNIPQCHIYNELSEDNARLFKYLPNALKEQLLLDRDPHGNVQVGESLPVREDFRQSSFQVAKIETEKLLALCVETELRKLEAKGEYKFEFSPQFHSFGYEGRCALPTHFDAHYCYALG